MAQKLPKITQNGPKNDAQIYALFPQFFFDWKGYPENFFAFRMYAKRVPNCLSMIQFHFNLFITMDELQYIANQPKMY